MQWLTHGFLEVMLSMATVEEILHECEVMFFRQWFLV